MKKTISTLLFLVLTSLSIGMGVVGYRYWSQPATQRIFISNAYGEQQTNPFRLENMMGHPAYAGMLATIQKGFEKPLQRFFSKRELLALDINKVYWDIPIKAFLQLRDYQYFHLLDAYAHRHQKYRYALTIQRGGRVPVIAPKVNHFVIWDEHFSSSINEKTIYLRSETLSDFYRAKIGLKIFDLAIIRMLDDENLLKEAVGLQEDFYASSIGNAKEKAICLYAHYKKADIVCLQGVSQEILDLMRQEYTLIGQVGGAAVCLKKGVWHLERVLPVRVAGYAPAGLVLVVAKDVKSGKRIVVGSIQSDSMGRYNASIIGAVDAALGKDPALFKIPVLIGHRANTGSSLQGYRKHFIEKGFKQVFSSRKPTVKRVYTYAQPQIEKAGTTEKQKDDWLLYKYIKVIKNNMTPAGPSEANPSDHSLLILHFAW